MAASVAFLLLSLQSVAAEQIDPKIYGKMLKVNTPMFDRMAHAVLEKLPSDSQVLDLGSGPGEPTLTLAKQGSQLAHYRIHVTCTDFQQAMVDKAIARIKDEGVDNVDFAQTSADDLSKWGDGAFDAVMANFVLMFVPNKERALQEIARVLKPGGYAYTAVWKELPFYKLAHDAIEEVAGKDMPEFAIQPLKLKEDNAVEDLAKAAGLEIVSSEVLDYPFNLGSVKDTADGTTILAGGMLKELEQAGDSEATKKFYSAVEDIIQKNGWQNELSGEVSVPGAKPQLLILHKRGSKSEL